MMSDTAAPRAITDRLLDPGVGFEDLRWSSLAEEDRNLRGLLILILAIAVVVFLAAVAWLSRSRAYKAEMAEDVRLYDAAQAQQAPTVSLAEYSARRKAGSSL